VAQRLDLGARHPALDTYHQRFQDETLPEELSQRGFASFDRSRYSEDELRRALGAWQLRTLDEYRSMAAFTELVYELTQLGCSFDILGTAVRVVRDEARHTELCRRMVVALGGEDVVPGEPRWVISDKRLPLRQRVLSTVVGSLCIGETLSTRMLAAVREQTTDPLARAVVTCLVADESVHGQFGWMLLEAFAPTFTPEDRQALLSMLPGALAGARAAMIPSGEVRGPHVPTSFGSLSPERRAEVFHHALARDVLPRFDELGLPGSAIWAALG
jgi:hypothetical protein